MTDSDQEQFQKTIKSESIYDGHLISLHVDTVELPDMKYAKREIVRHPNGVGVIAYSDHDTLYMVRQFRVAAKKSMLEIPAGLVDPGENPRDAASRELQEEVGFKPGKLEYLMDAYVSPGFTDEKLSLFLATELEKSKLPEDDTEFIQSFEYPVEELYRMVGNFEIEDAKTIIAILYAYFTVYRKKGKEE